MTFMFKQCAQHRYSNNTNRWMTFVSIPYKPMKNRFRIWGFLKNDILACVETWD